ncbi:hypothetical protein BDV25DRAFT_102857 [Aspergillus avenaceus]|uniref:DUF676 domain-containing protein n=1 Tax=Aspergillus avenaceus TaxID=36643 RepID=A0A5N6U7E3_ASPAV|nr:hypothetical protein BDV25DRAFT_102857 [Aspergillus avenaceus]
MKTFSFLTVTTGPYFLFKTVESNVLTDRIWSLNSFSLLFLSTLIFDFPVESYIIPLSALLLFNIALLIALHPKGFITAHETHPHYNALEIIHPKPQGTPNNQVNHEALIDIVAVPGPELDPRTAWKSEDRDWVREFLPKEDLPARILAFNPDNSQQSNGTSKSLYAHGSDLIQALVNVRRSSEEKKRPIIFIGHGVGGLIIKQALASSMLVPEGEPGHELWHHAKGFVFLGTPHRGYTMSPIGTILSLLRRWQGSSTDLVEVVEPGSVMNRTLHESFMKVLKRGCGVENTLCVYQEVKESLLGMPFTHVVDRDSAVIDGSEVVGFERQHFDLQRFRSREDPHYTDVIHYIRGWIG